MLSKCGTKVKDIVYNYLNLILFIEWNNKFKHKN